MKGGAVWEKRREQNLEAEVVVGRSLYVIAEISVTNHRISQATRIVAATV